MSRSAEQLAHRRQQLLAESARHRSELQAHGRHFKQHLASIDAGMSVLTRIRQQPLLMAGLAAAVVIFKPQRLLQKVQTGMLVWNGLRGFMPVLLPLIQDFLKRHKKP